MEVDTLDRFLSLPVWDEPHQAPAPPISGNDRKYRQVEIQALLAKAADGFLADVPFALIKPMGIGVRMGRFPAEKYLVLNEICDALRGHGNACVADIGDNDAWTAAKRRSPKDNAGLSKTVSLIGADAIVLLYARR
jgi:hypothetical protein